MYNLPWDLIQNFLLVAQKGSLSSAARELGVSQPTLSRSIQTIENKVKLQLFKRTTQGLILTEAGYKLVDAAESMGIAADQFQRQIAGISHELEGDVRISANEIVGIHLLPPALVAFRDKHPGIQIEIEISNQTTSLSKRDADIALRMYRPSQPDLVATRLPDMMLGFFATHEYIGEFGEPKSFEELKQHRVIGFDRDLSYIEVAQKLGIELAAQDFCLRTDYLNAQINLARAGGGIVATHVGLANRWPEFKQIMHWVPLPPLEFWIVCHSDTQYNSRIRELTKFLANWFSDNPYKNIVI